MPFFGRNTIPDYSPGEMLQWYFRTLADLAAYVKKRQRVFLAPLPGTVVAVKSEPRFAHVLLTYLCSTSFSFIKKNKKNIYLEQHILQNRYAPKGEPILEANHSFRV